MIIAEVGLNHQGRIAYSFKYLEQLILTDIDAVTYQIREKEFYENPPPMYRDLELHFGHYANIKEQLALWGKRFGIALADHDMVEQCEEINVDFYKTLSWNINSFDFLDKLVNTGKKIFVSTGTSSTDQIDKLQNRYRGENITLIHTQLQFEVENVNLLAIDFLKDRYDFPIAFGNHCENTDVLYTSVAFKPSDIFFYVKADKRTEHIDEKHSVRLSKVNKTVNSLIELSDSLGVPNKFDVEIEDEILILNTKDKK